MCVRACVYVCVRVCVCVGITYCVLFDRADILLPVIYWEICQRKYNCQIVDFLWEECKQQRCHDACVPVAVMMMMMMMVMINDVIGYNPRIPHDNFICKNRHYLPPGAI